MRIRDDDDEPEQSTRPQGDYIPADLEAHNREMEELIKAGMGKPAPPLPNEDP
jgi:hypothetical protein